MKYSKSRIYFILDLTWQIIFLIKISLMSFRRVFVFPGPRHFLGPRPWPQICIYRPWPPICIYRHWPPICIYRTWHQICIYQPWPPICIYRPWPPICIYPNLCLPQICIYRLNPAWFCIYRPCLPNLYLVALAYDLYAHRLHAKLIYPQWCWIM